MRVFRTIKTFLTLVLPSCRTLFKDASGTLDKSARFSPLYRQDSNKLSNDDVLKLLADFRKLVFLKGNRISSLADVLERQIWNTNVIGF